MEVYKLINLFTRAGKVFINVDQFYPVTEKNNSLKFKKMLPSLPISSLEAKDAKTFPSFGMNIIKLDPLVFEAAYVSKGILIGDDPKYIQPKTYQLISLIYELPTDPFKALYMIAVFDNYLIQTADCHFTQKFVRNNLDESGCLNDYLLNFLDISCYSSEFDNEQNFLKQRKNAYDDEHRLLGDLVTRSDIPNTYQLTLEKIKAFYAFCVFTNLSLANCLNNPRFNELISSNKNPYLLLDDHLEKSQHLNIVNEIKKDLLTRNNLDHWNTIIKDIITAKIYQLYSSCLDQKIAYDKNFYNVRYTEIQFLNHMMVNLKIKDGNRLCLSNLNKNPAYLDYYAPGCKNHIIFESELRFLGDYIGLKFEKDCDFHQEIILTSESSTFIEEKGFCYLIELNELMNTSQKTIKNSISAMFFAARAGECTHHLYDGEKIEPIPCQLV